MILTALPAYGRDYKSKEELFKDWEEGKDFTNMSPFIRGTYFSIRDLGSLKTDHNITAINFRYSHQRKVAVLEVK